ncbi:MAG: flagellar filament capping protein FliD, partial [Pseudomonadota bacterium]
MNEGSSIIAALGAGSGINFTQLAEDLAEASFGPQREALEVRNDDLQARISVASQLRSTLTELSSALGDRIRLGDLSPQISLGNSSVARVSIGAGTSPSGNYSLEVSQLADSQTLVSQSFGSGSDLVGEGSLRIRFGTVSGTSFTQDTNQAALDIAVSATDTLDDVAASITSQSEGALEAYVVQGTAGAQLVVKGQEGAANGFVLEPTSTGAGPAGVPGDLSYLGWDPASDSGELRATAQDALFELDTVPISSPSNTVTGLPEGFTLELTGTNVGAPTELSFNTDTGAIEAVMGDLAAALNDVVNFLNEEASPGGTLSNDPGVRELRRDLANLTSEIVIPGAGDGEPSTLADLGLSLTRDGTFQIDSDRLSRTLTDNADAAAAMFTTGPTGVF